MYVYGAWIGFLGEPGERKKERKIPAEFSFTTA